MPAQTKRKSLPVQATRPAEPKSAVVGAPEARKRKSRTKFDPSKAIPLPTGRPSVYSDEIADYIEAQIILGRDLLDICDHDQCVPWRGTVYRWMGLDEAFKTRITRAREVLADHAAQKVDRLIENVTSATANAARIKLLGLQWLAAKRHPQVYSDRYQGANINVSVTLESLVGQSYEAPKTIVQRGTAQDVDDTSEKGLPVKRE